MTEVDRSQAERFASWLLQVGEGRLNDSDDGMTVRLPTGKSPPNHDNSYTTLIYIDLQLPASDGNHIKTLIDKVYPDIEQLHLNDDDYKRHYFSERVILAARNSDVDTINSAVMTRVSGEAKTYLSADTAFKDSGVPDPSMPQEYLNTVNLPGMPLHNTPLKIGSPIILI